ncbi:protein translocase subunit SecD, partial [bacterium]|nr:protein translocase subunit SecD [bacterium]
RKDNNLPDDFSIATVTRINELVRKTIPEESEVAFQTHYDPVTNKISGGTPFLLKRKAEVTGDMLQNVQVQVHNNEPYVSLVFNKMGTKLFGDVTKNNVGKRLAIMLDGRVDKAPVIRDAILSGHAQITFGMGTYNNLMREAEDLVLILQEGALPASMTEATKTVVGPSLGQDSINKGIKSIAIGGFLVVLFMFIYYRLSGALANLALVLNIIFIMALLALFQATLTLPGIAGIVLTIGMAVDANVIIFERIREEIKLGKTARAAIDSGYSNAMRAILDANITTLIAGVVLYQFGTGPIRGFAVTLIMGIVASLFTAIVITRTVYDYFSVKRKIQRISI